MSTGKRIKALIGPFLAYATIGVALQIFVYMYEIQYDDDGLRGVVFWAAQLFGILFWAVNELFLLLHHGRAFAFQFAISIFFSIGLALLLDTAVRRLRRHSG